MEKMLAMAISLVLMAGIACAEISLEEEDYKNLDKLHNKIVRMKKEMDRLMKDIVETYPTGQGVSVTDFGQDVRVDVIENEKDIVVKADLPGMDKDRIDITLENNKTLKITGVRDIIKKESSPGVVMQERSLGKFERVLELPAEGTSVGIKASYKDGVLEIVIPKREPSKEEKVKIKVS